MKFSKKEVRDMHRFVRAQRDIKKRLITLCKHAGKAECLGSKDNFVISLDSKDPLKLQKKKGERIAKIKYSFEMSKYPK
jgi:hypothetical protein